MKFWSYCCLSFHWLSNKLKTELDAPFHCRGYGYSRADWDGLCDHLKDVPWEDILKLSASAASNKFCEWVQVGNDVYIPHCRYQVKPHSSSRFSAACAASIVHRNHFFHFYQQDKSSKSKAKYRQASNCWKRVLESTKLAYGTKTKESITSQKLGSQDFWRLLTVFSTKVNLLYLLYSMTWRCCLLLLKKQNCLLKTFLRTLILMTKISLYQFLVLELIWNYTIFH